MLKTFKNTEDGILVRLLKWIALRILPTSVCNWLGLLLYGSEYRLSLGSVRLGNLRRVTPISRVYGCDRGQPIDRYYIENYLANCSSDIHGHVLEIADAHYTKCYGGNRVTKSDVLHVKEGNPEATIVADISSAHQIPSDTFDCIILTQTLQFIYDFRAAIETLFRILKPGGVVLVTFPGISQRNHEEEKGFGGSWYWSFNSNSARRLFEEVFPAANVRIEAHGNVLSAIAFLHGLATEELRQKELDHYDPNYQVLIAVRAVKPASEG